MTLTRLKFVLVAFALLLGSSVTTSVLTAPNASAAQTCTHTSSGSCIRGGEFCPQASYGQTGTDDQGRHYLCTGSTTRPHWEVSTGSGGSGSRPKSKPKYHGPVLSDGAGDIASTQYKSKTTYLTGDGTLTMFKSHWTKWTKTKAVGHGVGHYNTCNPDCGDGKIIKVKMKLVETRPRNRCGKRVFTKYAVTFLKKPTKHASKHLTLTRSSIACN